MNKITIRERDSGFMSVEWLLGIALLVIPVFILTVNLLQYPPRKSLSQVAASEAVKAFVQADNLTAAKAAAQDAVRTIIENEMSINDAQYDAMNAKEPFVDFSKFRPNDYCNGKNVTLTVSLPMPIIYNPFSKSKASIASIAPVRSDATERIDDYTELEESSSCPDI